MLQSVKSISRRSMSETSDARLRQRRDDGPAVATTSDGNPRHPLRGQDRRNFRRGPSGSIYIFLDGGLSHVDSYDYKPLLQRDDGKPLPASIAKPKFTFAPTGSLLKSPFDWKQWGQSGMWASDLFPQTNRLIDDFCFIHSLHHDNEDHFTAKNMIFTGSGREARPPLGSWLAYGLGTENENLPGVYRNHARRAEGFVVGVSAGSDMPAAAIGRPDMKSQGPGVGQSSQPDGAMQRRSARSRAGDEQGASIAIRRRSRAGSRDPEHGTGVPHAVAGAGTDVARRRIRRHQGALRHRRRKDR